MALLDALSLTAGSLSMDAAAASHSHSHSHAHMQAQGAEDSAFAAAMGADVGVGMGMGVDADVELVKLVYDAIDRTGTHAALHHACTDVSSTDAASAPRAKRAKGKSHFEGLVRHLLLLGRVDRLVAASLRAEPARSAEALELVRLFHR